MSHEEMQRVFAAILVDSRLADFKELLLRTGMRPSRFAECLSDGTFTPEEEATIWKHYLLMKMQGKFDGI